MSTIKQESSLNNQLQNFMEVNDCDQKDISRKTIINDYSAHDLSLTSLKIEKVSSSSSSSSSNLPIQSILPPLDLSIQQSGYQPKTLSLHNMKRWDSLPKFPSLNIDDQSSIHLLLTNVPLLNLCVEEIFRRQYGCDDLICYENVSDPSIIRQDTHLLYQLFINLSQQWRVSVPLLAYNYEQMISSV
ncbi:unnamed protein product, partial [Rotaria sp. Silwood2]